MLDLNRDGFTDVQDIILACTAVITVLTAAVVLRKQIVKPMGKWIQNQFREAVNATITEPLEEIRHEVTTNDGGSLKDLVKRQHAETLAIFEERDKRFARLAQPADQRVKLLEAGFRNLDDRYSEILTRLDSLGTQAATDSAKVLDKLDHNSTD